MVSRAVVGSASEPPRVAYAIGGRVGGAVVRNRVRRRLRAAARTNAEQLEPGHAYLVRVAPGGASASFGELSTSLHGALRALREGSP